MLTPQQRRAVRGLVGVLEKSLVQGRITRHAGAGSIQAGAQLRLGQGQQVWRRVVPGVFGQPVEASQVGVEHGFDQPLGEQADHAVPVQGDAAVGFHHLMIEPYLWGLGQAEYLPGERPVYRCGGAIRHPRALVKTTGMLTCCSPRCRAS